MQTRTAILTLLTLVSCAGVSASRPADPQRGDRPAPPAKKDAPAEPSAEPARTLVPETITRKLPDSVVMTADLYRRSPAANDDPVLVCMHMTGSSRGEYAPYAARLVDSGFNVLAVDLRCGGPGDRGDRRTGKRSGVVNQTWESARKVMGREPNYEDAYPDVGAAVAWAHELYPHSKLGLVGSSYSATLALVYAAENGNKVDGVIALSPGDYVTGWSPVKERIKKITVPAYITCGNTPIDVNHAKPIAEAILDKSKLITFWPEDEGYVGSHGTMTLVSPDERSRAKEWEMLEKALARLKKPVKKDATPAK